jgi:hypothetical protein
VSILPQASSLKTYTLPWSPTAIAWDERWADQEPSAFELDEFLIPAFYVDQFAVQVLM